MNCPRCQATSAAGVQQCTCGYEFPTSDAAKVSEPPQTADALEPRAADDNVVEVDLTSAVALRGMPRMLIFLCLSFALWKLVEWESQDFANYLAEHSSDSAGHVSDWGTPQIFILFCVIYFVPLAITVRGSYTRPWVQAFGYLPVLLLIGILGLTIGTGINTEVAGPGVFILDVFAAIALLYAATVFAQVPLALLWAAMGLNFKLLLRSLLWIIAAAAVVEATAWLIGAGLEIIQNRNSDESVAAGALQGPPSALASFIGPLLWLPVALFVLNRFVSLAPNSLLRLAFQRKKGSRSYGSFVRRHASLTSWVALGLGAAIFGIIILVVVMVFAMGWPIAVAVATFLFNEIRRRLNQSVTWEAVEEECRARSSCVYLRSFWDDGLGFGPDFFWPGLWVMRPPNRRLEEIAVRAIWPFYAVVAVGESARGDSPTAAFRAPATVENWQSVVAELTRSAKLVVLLAGYSPGLKWEHGQLRSANALTRTLVLMPPGDKGERRDRWEALLRSGYFTGGSDDSYEPSASDRHNVLFHTPVRTGMGDWLKAALKRIQHVAQRVEENMRPPSTLGELVDRTIACIWTEDGRRVHFTSRLESRLAYELTLRLACVPMEEVLKLAVQ